MTTNQDTVAGAPADEIESLLAGITDILRQERDCSREAARARAERIVRCPDEFEYAPWRHGGWYVYNVHHASGACGCVSRNYVDKKWRIVCNSPHEVTFRSRDDAARAEHARALADWKHKVASVGSGQPRE